MARSEEKTDWAGNKYIQHYDDSSDKCGWSEERTGWSGDHYTQHYDQSGSKTGHSESRTDWSGSAYTQHHDQAGDNTGWSGSETSWTGDHYTQHHDQSGANAGWSEKKTSWVGERYTRHHDTKQFSESPSGTGAYDSSSTNGDRSLSATYSDSADYSYSEYSSSDGQSGGFFSGLTGLVIVVAAIWAFSATSPKTSVPVESAPAAPDVSQTNPIPDQQSLQLTPPPVSDFHSDENHSDITDSSEEPAVLSDEKPDVTVATPIGAHECREKYESFRARFGNRIGDVKLRYTIGVDGSVANPEVIESSGNYALDRLASSCLRSWSYSPAQQDGVAVESFSETVIKFRNSDAR